MLTSVEIIVPIASFILVVAIVKIVADSRLRHKLIDKGLVDEKVKYLFSNKMAFDGPASLKWGMVLLAIGAAVIIGEVVRYRHHDVVTIASMFILSGLALIIYYFIAKRMKNGAPPQG